MVSPSPPPRKNISKVLSMANQEIAIDESTLQAAMDAASSLNHDYSKEKQEQLPRRLLNFEPNEDKHSVDDDDDAVSSTAATTDSNAAMKKDAAVSMHPENPNSTAATNNTDDTVTAAEKTTTSSSTRPSLQSPEFKLKKNPVNTPEEYRNSAMYNSISSLQGCTPLKMSPLDGRHHSQGSTTNMNQTMMQPPHPTQSAIYHPASSNGLPYPSPANYYHKYPTQKYSPEKEELFQPSPQFENFDAFANNVLNSGGSDHYLMTMNMNSPWSGGMNVGMNGVGGSASGGMGSSLSRSGGIHRRVPYDLHDQPVFNEHHDSPINIAKQQSRTQAAQSSSSSSHHRKSSSSTSPAKYHTPIITSGNERKQKGETTAQTMSSSTASSHNYENYHDVSADQNHPMNYYHRPFGMRGSTSSSSNNNSHPHPHHDASEHISPAKFEPHAPSSSSHHGHMSNHHHHHGHGHPSNTVYATPNFARSSDATTTASSSDSRMMPPATHSGNKYGVPNSTGSGSSNMGPSQHGNHHIAHGPHSYPPHDLHSSHAPHLGHHPHGPPSAASFHAPPSSHHHPHAQHYGAPPSHPHSHDVNHHHHPHPHSQHGPHPQQHQYPMRISPYGNHGPPGSSHPQQFGPGGVPPPQAPHGQYPSPYYNNFQMPNAGKRKKPDKPPGTKKQAKTAKRKKMYSDYVGVTYNKTHAKYQACITHYRKQHYLGRYKLACDAAKSYDQAAVLLKGDSWKINFDSEEEYNTAREKEIEVMIAKKKKDIEGDEEETNAFNEENFRSTLVVTFSSEETLKDKLGMNETVAPPQPHMQQHNMYAPPPSHMHHGGYNRPYSHPANPYHGHPMSMNQNYGYAPPNSAEAPYSIMKPKAPMSGPVPSQPPQSHGMNSASKMTNMGPTAQGKLDPITPSPNAPALAANDTPAHSMMMSPNMNFMGTSPSANSLLGNSMGTPFSVLGSSVVKVKRESSTPKDFEHVSANMFASPDAIKGQNKSSMQNKPAHSEAVSALLEMSSTEKAPKPVQ